MIDAEERPVQTDPATLATLNELVHSLGTDELTQHAISLGVRPPDDRPDWAIVLEYAPNLTERGLFWVGPDDE
jgi:hypothetical protein